MNDKSGRLPLTLLLFFIAFILKAETKLSNQIHDFGSYTAFEQVDTLSKLCWFNREKNTELALNYGLQAIEIAKTSGYKRQLGKVYNYVGVIYQHYKDNTQKAIEYYNEGLKISLQEKDSTEIAYVYNNLGDAFFKIGNIPLASEYAEKSMNIFQRLNDKRGIAYSYVNMGFVSRISKDYENALDYFQQAIALRRTFGDSIGIASATLEVARTLYQMNRSEEAMPYFRNSLEKHQNLINKNYMAYSMQGLADIYLDKNELDSALHYYQKALVLCRERKNPTGMIISQRGIAMVYANLEKEQAGEAILDTAFLEAKASQITKNLLDVYKTKGKFYNQLKNYRKASENYQNYIVIYDSLFSELQFQTLSEIKDRFKVTEQLTKINEDLRHKKKEQTYTLIIVVLLLIMALILVFRYRTTVRFSKELKQLNQTKDKIFSIISHDLVSPFNVLIGTSELLLDDLEEKEYEAAKKNGHLINDTANDTFHLVTNLLNWAKMQREHIDVNKEKINVLPLMEEVKSILDHQAMAKNISILISTNKETFIYADKSLLRIVLINLVSNAIKFTNPSGVIHLEATKNNENVKISVRDEGVGIGKERIATLLDQHKIESTTGTKSEKGTGLGLLLCKDFIEMHNSKLQIESTEGKGSTFSFILQTN